MNHPFADEYFAGMAVFAALGNTFGSDAMATIFSFLDDSSIVTNGSWGEIDVADLTEFQDLRFFSDIITQRYNYSLSNALISVQVSERYWLLKGT